MPTSNINHVIGIIGYPLSHSLSPFMHNTAISFYKMDYVYLPFEVHPENLSSAVSGIRALGIEGVNVTIPHKENIIQHLDLLSEEAKLIGAVNTIVFKNGKLIGYNTDCAGFIDSLKEDAKVSPRGSRVLILGAGGAARAVAVGLAMEKASRIIIANRTVKKGEKLAEFLLKSFPSLQLVKSIPFDTAYIAKELRYTDIVINSTSKGMMGKNNITAFPYNELNNKHLVCDLVYNPIETYFLKKSREYGTKVLDGLGMLIRQGDRSFFIWTKKKLPISEVTPILKSKLLT